MGDRGNIVLTEQGGNVYLYSHWMGSDLPALARKGLAKAKRGGRLDDSQYCGRIVTDVFLKAHADSPFTGAGVSGVQGDGGDTVVIDYDSGEVHVWDDDTDDHISMTFDEFIEGK